MIQEHIVQGSKDTTLHNFTIDAEGMSVTIHPGSYYRAGVELYHLEEDVTLDIPSSGDYSIWLTNKGFKVVSMSQTVQGAIDLLAWLTASDTIENIHFMRMVEVDAG